MRRRVPVKPSRPRAQVVEGVAQAQPDGERGERVEDVVAARDLQGDLAELARRRRATVNVEVLPAKRRSVARTSASADSPTPTT